MDSVVFGTANPDHQQVDTEAFERMSEVPTHSQIAVLPERRRHALTHELAVALGSIARTGILVRHPVRVTSAVRR